ncbi:MAG: helix-turn-helix domain-containing protein [Solirubrobacterales bacterium]|nr:helix-turn-helix domain-containing protein [Solirubrobacterales bacterium]
MALLSGGEMIRRIVARSDVDEFSERVLDSFWELPAFQETHPPRDDVRAWVRWNLDLVIRWLVEARAPTDGELEVFRQHARDRAADGTPADIVPANFRRGARFAWRALLEAATDEERPALLESADLLFEYVDRVSRIYSEVYAEATRAAPAGDEERGARTLLQRIARDEDPLPEDHQLAERLGFGLERAARPFVIAVPGWPSERYLGLATQLRRRGAVAASEGRRVVGLASARASWEGLELSSHAVIAAGPPAIRAERSRSLEELRLVASVALQRGRTGSVALADYLPELLLRRSPRIAAAVRNRVYGPLEGAHPELARTLDMLVRHGFERGVTAAALPVHRNTLRDRVKRIGELTGVDLDAAEGRGLAWLAWLERGDSAPREPSAVRRV